MAEHFEHLNAGQLVDTLTKLHSRIQERFPGSGLAQLAAKLCDVARQATRRTASIRRIIWPLRLLGWALALCMPLIVAYVVAQGTFRLETDGWQLLEGIDAGLSSMVFLGGAIFFVVTLERRIRRRRALAAIAELRGLAHLVDMHQLAKDPERSFADRYISTKSSPTQPLSPFLLGRYLDYCSEMLSLISKVCVLYGQDFDDEVVLDAVDDIEDLTGGMSRRIWQKIMLLDSLESRSEMRAQRQPAAPAPAATPSVVPPASPHPLANLEIAGGGPGAVSGPAAVG